jgi:hypothetical protein
MNALRIGRAYWPYVFLPLRDVKGTPRTPDAQKCWEKIVKTMDFLTYFQHPALPKYVLVDGLPMDHRVG